MTEDRLRLLQAHYTGAVENPSDTPDLGARILACLQAAGKDLDRLTLDDLAPVDQFHTGGKGATLGLLDLAGLHAGMEVLDVGGGLGGPARLLASVAGCHVTVLDLTEAYCQAGTMLTRRLGLAGRVTFCQSDALAMPFGAEQFDAVWLQNVSMNIADKAGLFAEIHRVLKPEGCLAFQDIMAGPVQPVVFPVPWARDASFNFLWPPDEMRTLLGEIGFQERAWIELPPPARPEDARPGPAVSGASPATLSYQVLLGDAYPEMARNSVRNREERRTVMVQAVFARERAQVADS
jgi:MPBQ/MSBQ methyltransferase